MKDRNGERSMINSGSRYHNSFLVLKTFIDPYKLFDLIYNEDKETYSLPYLYFSYKNKFDPVAIASNMMYRIEKYLKDNLFNQKEKKLLISELIPHAKDFGEEICKKLIIRAESASDDPKHNEHAGELRKTVSCLRQINEILNNELITYFTEITAAEIADQRIAINAESRLEKLQEQILDEFRKSKSRANTIVMMKRFRVVILDKLNPKEQKLFVDAVNELIANGYVKYEDGMEGTESLRLMQKGFDRIYDDHYAAIKNSILVKYQSPSPDFPDELYKDVLKTISNYGKDLEQKPKIYKSQDEEGLRDHFITNLTSRYEKTTATGETFNKNGKTDILLKDQDGNNLFIAECKWWKGADVFQSTINQLFNNYITWRDTKVAVIFFVENKNFTNVLSQVVEQAATHPYHIKYVCTTGETNFSFLFKQKDDTSNIVQVEVMLFHFPL